MILPPHPFPHPTYHHHSFTQWCCLLLGSPGHSKNNNTLLGWCFSSFFLSSFFLLNLCCMIKLFLFPIIFLVFLLFFFLLFFFFSIRTLLYDTVVSFSCHFSLCPTLNVTVFSLFLNYGKYFGFGQWFLLCAAFISGHSKYSETLFRVRQHP